MESDNSWGGGDGWCRVMELIEVAKTEHDARLSPERRRRIFQQVLARAAADRRRQRLLRAFAAGASMVVLGGLLFWLAAADQAHSSSLSARAQGTASSRSNGIGSPETSLMP